MTPVALAQAFLFDLAVAALLPGFLPGSMMVDRARRLAGMLADETEPAVAEARDFLTGIADGVLEVEECGARARDLGVALEPYR